MLQESARMDKSGVLACSHAVLLWTGEVGIAQAAVCLAKLWRRKHVSSAKTKQEDDSRPVR